jgi:hypothetical protein
MTQALYPASPTTKVIIKIDIAKHFMLKNIKNGHKFFTLMAINY